MPRPLFLSYRTSILLFRMVLLGTLLHLALLPALLIRPDPLLLPNAQHEEEHEHYEGDPVLEDGVDGGYLVRDSASVGGECPDCSIDQIPRVSDEVENSGDKEEDNGLHQHKLALWSNLGLTNGTYTLEMRGPLELMGDKDSKGEDDPSP